MQSQSKQRLMTRYADSTSTAGRDPRVTVPPYRIKPRDLCRRIVHPGEALLRDSRDGERGRWLALPCTGRNTGIRGCTCRRASAEGLKARRERIRGATRQGRAVPRAALRSCHCLPQGQYSGSSRSLNSSSISPRLRHWKACLTRSRSRWGAKSAMNSYM